MKISITSVHEIAAAHYLPYHEGKCRRRHGHNYVIKFTLVEDSLINSGPETGMVMDFGTFDAEIKRVLEQVDHHSLNDECGIENPTAENLALWLLDRLPVVDIIEIWETGRHYVTVDRSTKTLTSPPPSLTRLHYVCPDCKNELALYGGPTISENADEKIVSVQSFFCLQCSNVLERQVRCEPTEPEAGAPNYSNISIVWFSKGTEVHVDSCEEGIS